MRRCRLRRSLRVNLFLQMGQANFPTSSSSVCQRDGYITAREFRLTICLMAGQVLDAAEVLRTPGTLKPLARRRRGGLWPCRFFRGPARGSFCTAFPRRTTAGGRSLHSVHVTSNHPASGDNRVEVEWQLSDRVDEERASLGEEGMGFWDGHWDLASSGCRGVLRAVKKWTGRPHGGNAAIEHLLCRKLSTLVPCRPKVSCRIRTLLMHD